MKWKLDPYLACAVLAIAFMGGVKLYFRHHEKLLDQARMNQAKPAVSFLEEKNRQNASLSFERRELFRLSVLTQFREVRPNLKSNLTLPKELKPWVMPDAIELKVNPLDGASRSGFWIRYDSWNLETIRSRLLQAFVDHGGSGWEPRVNAHRARTALIEGEVPLGAFRVMISEYEPDFYAIVEICVLPTGS